MDENQQERKIPGVRLTYDEFGIHIGQLIRAAREELGYSQAELATAIHRRQASLSAMENGKMEPDARTIMHLAIMLRKPVSYFFPPVVRFLAGEEGNDPEEKALLRQFRRLWSEKYRKIAVNQVTVLAEFELHEDYGGNEFYKLEEIDKLIEESEQNQSSHE